MTLLKNAMKILNDREKEIINARRLSEEPKTLEELSKIYKISRERIRQIETKAFEKLQKSMINASKSKNFALGLREHVAQAQREVARVVFVRPRRRVRVVRVRVVAVRGRVRRERRGVRGAEPVRVPGARVKSAVVVISSRLRAERPSRAEVDSRQESRQVLVFNVYGLQKI